MIQAKFTGSKLYAPFIFWEKQVTTRTLGMDISLFEIKLRPEISLGIILTNY